MHREVSPLHKYLQTLKSFKESYQSSEKQCDNSHGRWNYHIVAAQLILPLLIATILDILNVTISERSNILSVVSIITGLMCTVAALLFETRANTMKNKNYLGKIDAKAADDLYYLTIWIITIGIFAALVLIAPDFDWHNHIPILLVDMYSFVCICLISHFAIVVMSFAKRMISLYVRVAEGKE